MTGKKHTQDTEASELQKMVADLYKSENELLMAEAEYRTIIETAMDGFLMIDMQGQFLDVNQSYCDMIGYGREEMLKMRIKDVEALEKPEDTAKHLQKIILNGHDRFESRLRCRDGKIIIVEASANYSKDAGERIFSFVRDITGRKQMEAECKKHITDLEIEVTERKKTEETLRNMTFMDELTGLCNRRGFLNIAGQEIKISNRSKRSMLLFFIDMDHLKDINDIYGHQEGDNALIQTADILRNTFRCSDIIARIAGDEFVVMAMDTTSDHAKVIKIRLEDNINRFNNSGKSKFKLSLSTGVASYNPDAACLIDELIARADKLMYEEKQRKRNSSQKHA
jgi:diguanylate cyclase (GGDEF)-like protein/PAS domain S-box-containing protein